MYYSFFSIQEDVTPVTVCIYMIHFLWYELWAKVYMNFPPEQDDKVSPNREEIYGRDSQRDVKPQGRLTVCSRQSNCTFPRLAVTSRWRVCLFWHTGQDLTALTTPKPTLTPTHGTHTHTQTHILPATGQLRTEYVCTCGREFLVC